MITDGRSFVYSICTQLSDPVRLLQRLTDIRQYLAHTKPLHAILRRQPPSSVGILMPAANTLDTKRSLSGCVTLFGSTVERKRTRRVAPIVASRIRMLKMRDSTRCTPTPNERYNEPVVLYWSKHLARLCTVEGESSSEEPASGSNIEPLKSNTTRAI
jgi:hypothetical protein